MNYRMIREDFQLAQLISDGVSAFKPPSTKPHWHSAISTLIVGLGVVVLVVVMRTMK